MSADLWTLASVTIGLVVILLGVVALWKQGMRSEAAPDESRPHADVSGRAPVDADGREAPRAELQKLAAGLSHELANSLTAIQGFARLIDASRLSDADREAWHAVQLEIVNVTRTLAEFRMLVRTIELRRMPTDLVEIVDGAARMAAEALQVSPDSIAYKGDRPLMLDADPLRLEDALRRLFQNGVEACLEAGRVPMVCVDARRGTTNRHLCVRITDLGAGVPEEVRGRIFEPFYSTKSGHLGLGLAFAERIVRAHGGTITPLHPPDSGFVLDITLPLADPASVPPSSR